MVIGAVIGLERAMTKKMKIIGVRTFVLAAVLGYFSGALGDVTPYVFPPVLLSITALLFILLQREKSLGLTTALSFLLTFLLSFSLNYIPPHIPLLTAIFVSIVLAEREEIRRVSMALERREFLDIVEFLLIALVLLPQVPSTYMGLPVRTVLSVIVLASAVSFLGYLLTRVHRFSPEAWGFLSGLVNSMAAHYYASSMRGPFNALIFSSMARYLRNFVVFALIVGSGPLALLPVPLYLFLYFVFREESRAPDFPLPFSTTRALVFGAFTLFTYAALVLLDLPPFFGGVVDTLAATLASGTVRDFLLVNAAGTLSDLALFYLAGGRSRSLTLAYLIMVFSLVMISCFA